ncbi:MAG: FapA family protein [bacterium]
MADADAETTDDSPDEEADVELPDEELKNLEDSLEKVQGTTIRSSEIEGKEKSKVKKEYAFNKHEAEFGEEQETGESVEAQLEKISESLENFEAVNPGQLVAADLTGDGEPRFKAGKYIRAAEDNRRLFASRAGQVVWSGDTVHVLPLMHVDGDVDSDTGDIRYDGNIFIEGKVGVNRLVQARGNVWIMGMVGSSRVKASGDVIIQGGFEGGKKQKIEAHGLVYGKFAENARIQASSKVIIKEAIKHSNIKAAESIILADQDANIVGGEVAANELIVANDLGSTSSPSTKLRLGARGILQEELEKLENLRAKLENEVEEKEKNVNKLIEKEEAGSLSPADEKKLRELEFDFNYTRDNFQQVNQRIEGIREELNSNVDRKIYVRGTVFPGVKLHIGTIKEPIDKEHNHCTIRGEENEINFDSFNEPELDLDFNLSVGEKLEEIEEKYETPDLEELRRNVIYEEDEEMFNREDQLRTLLGIEDDKDLALIELDPEPENSGDQEEGEELKQSKTWRGIEVREDEKKQSVRRYFDPNAKKSVKVKCKSPEEGVKRAAKYLEAAEDELVFKVLEKGKSGFMGFGEKDFLIRVIRKDEIEQSSEESSAKSSEEEANSFGLLEQAEQQGEADGFIDFENTADGLKLAVHPPEGNGFPVAMGQVKEELKENNYDQDINWDKVEELVGNPTGELKVIGPCQRDSNTDGSFSIEVNDSETEAYLTVIPPKSEGIPITEEEVEEYLEAEGFNYDKQKLSEVFEKERFEEEIVIASGQEPEQGRDGEIKFTFAGEGPQSEEEEAPEVVDHHSVNNIAGVEEDEVLAKIIPPTDGEPGVSIYGDELPPEPGASVELEAGENTRFSEDGTEVVAETGGRVRLVGEEDDQKLLVEPVFEINGDLDYEIGNVDMEGIVAVDGKILDGFQVSATQRVEAESVGKAHVKSGGDIIVDQGIVGRDEGFLEAEGNIFAKYIENARLKAGGSVVVEQAIMHSQVDAEEYVIVDGQRRGDIIGGITRAGEAIQAQKIGGELASETEVECGISPELRDKFSELVDEIEERQELMDKTKNGLKGLKKEASKVGGVGKLPADKKELKDKLTARAKTIKKEINSLGDQLDGLKSKIEEMSGGKILVSDTLMSGVKMTIQKNSIILTEDHRNCKFKLHENEFTEDNFEPLEVELEQPD